MTISLRPSYNDLKVPYIYAVFDTTLYLYPDVNTGREPENKPFF